MLRTMILAGVLCCGGLAVAGCSVTVTTPSDVSITKQSLEQGISDVLQKQVGQRPDAVTCPGPIKAQAGQTVRCELTAGSTKYGLTATVNSYSNGTANYTVQVDNKPSN